MTAFMTKQRLFAELIKDLAPFDRKVVLALEGLSKRQDAMTIKTSRFELLSLLRLEYSPENVERLDLSLERIAHTPLFLPGPTAGFAIATLTVAETLQKEGSEKLIIRLGKLFALGTQG
jgi:hypothetical protein